MRRFSAIVIPILAAAALTLTSCRHEGYQDPYHGGSPDTAACRCECGAAWGGGWARCTTCGRESSCRCPACHRWWPPGAGCAGRCPWCGAIVDVGPDR